jgi:hypothetical protein
MADQIRVDIVATDKASEKIEDVAQAAEELEANPVKVEILTSDEKAQADIQQIKEDLGLLERTPTKVTLLAQADALNRELNQVKADLKTLDQLDPKIEVKGGESLNKVEKGLEGINREAPSSVGALRDVAGGMNNAGGAALDAGEALLGVGETLGTLNPKLAGLGQAMAKVGFVGGAIATGVIAVVEVFDRLTGTTKKLAQGLKDVQLNAGLTSKSVEAFAKATKAARDNLKDASNWIDNWTDLVSNANDDTRKTAKAVETFNKVLKDSPAAARNLLDQLEQLGAQSGLTSDQLDQMEQSLKDHMQLEVQAALGTEKWNEQVKAQVEAQKAAEAGLVQSTTALEHHGQAIQDDVSATEDLGKSTKTMSERMQDARDSAENLAGTLFDSRDKTRAARDAIREAGDAAKELAKKAGKATQDDVDAFAESIDRMAQAALDSGVGIDGAILAVTDLQTHTQKGSPAWWALEDLRQQLEYFKKVSIPIIEINVDTSDALRKLVALDTALKAAGKATQKGPQFGTGGMTTPSAVAQAQRIQQKRNGWT